MRYRKVIVRYVVIYVYVFVYVFIDKVIVYEIELLIK